MRSAYCNGTVSAKISYQYENGTHVTYYNSEKDWEIYKLKYYFIYSKQQTRPLRELFQTQLGNDILVFPQFWVQNQNTKSFT